MHQPSDFVTLSMLIAFKCDFTLAFIYGYEGYVFILIEQFNEKQASVNGLYDF